MFLHCFIALSPWHINACSLIMWFLVQDKRNFMRNPPAGVQFHFDYEASFPIAMVMLEEDEDLKEMRFKIVPKEWVNVICMYAVFQKRVPPNL